MVASILRLNSIKLQCVHQKEQKKKIMLLQIATLIQCASAQPFIPMGYSFESVSKSEPLMRIIKYAIVFVYKKNDLYRKKHTVLHFHSHRTETSIKSKQSSTIKRKGPQVKPQKEAELTNELDLWKGEKCGFWWSALWRPECTQKCWVAIYVTDGILKSAKNEQPLCDLNAYF